MVITKVECNNDNTLFLFRTVLRIFIDMNKPYCGHIGSFSLIRGYYSGIVLSHIACNVSRNKHSFRQGYVKVSIELQLIVNEFYHMLILVVLP